jgi:hypothetical protein
VFRWYALDRYHHPSEALAKENIRTAVTNEIQKSNPNQTFKIKEKIQNEKYTTNQQSQISIAKGQSDRRTKNANTNKSKGRANPKQDIKYTHQNNIDPQKQNKKEQPCSRCNPHPTTNHDLTP